MVNEPQAHSSPFLAGGFWRILPPEEARFRRWPRPMKCVNEPNGFLAPGTYAEVHLGRMYGLCMGCEQWDSRVAVSVPAGCETTIRCNTRDRTSGAPKRIELRIAKSNRREGRR